MNTFFQTTLLASALTAAAALTLDTSSGSDVEAIEKMSLEQAIDEELVQAVKEIGEELKEDCDELGGTDSDAMEWDQVYLGDRHILRHALWVETSFIPRMKCLLRKGMLHPNKNGKT